MTLIRSSIIFLYLRIFPIRWFRVTCYSVLIVNTVSFVAMMVSDLLAVYDVGCPPDVPCTSSTNLQSLTDFLVLVFNLLLDVVVVILPIPTLWRLQMPVTKKMMLSGMFGLGILICVITAFRLEACIRDFAFKRYAENSEAGYEYEVLAYFEPVLSVITACLPVLKPVFNKAHHSIRRIGGKLDKRSFLEFESIPIVMRVSQIWHSVSAQRAERDGMSSTVALEDWRRVQTEIDSRSQAERPEGINLPDIHVQKDTHIEITPDEDQAGAQGV